MTCQQELDETVVVPRCPVCREPVREPCFHCPACRTACHPGCFRTSGCVVAGCPGRRTVAGPRQDSDPTSRLWTPCLCCWALLSVGALLSLFLSATASPMWRLVPGPLLSAVMWVSVTTTGLAFSHDLVLEPNRKDQMGTLACALLFVTLPVSVLLSWTFPWALSTVLSVGLGSFGLFAIVGMISDRRKVRAVAALPLALVAVFLAGAITQALDHRQRANSRACYSNQKCIAGAIEMYDLDKNTKVTSLDPAMWKALRSGGYLQWIPPDPGEGPGSNPNYRFTPGGNRVRCEVHGSIQ